MTDQDQKWNDALDLFVEHMSRPDHRIRALERDAGCCNELQEIESMVYEYLRTLRRK